MMKLQVMTPDKQYVDEDVESATLPTLEGEITVLSGHDVLITMLKEGRLCYRKSGATHDEKPIELYIGGGGAEVAHESVSVFTKSVTSDR